MHTRKGRLTEANNATWYNGFDSSTRLFPKGSKVKSLSNVKTSDVYTEKEIAGDGKLWIVLPSSLQRYEKSERLNEWNGSRLVQTNVPLVGPLANRYSAVWEQTQNDLKWPVLKNYNAKK